MTSGGTRRRVVQKCTGCPAPPARMRSYAGRRHAPGLSAARATAAAGQTEGLGGFGFVEARILQRLLHHRALDRLQIVCGRRMGGSRNGCSLLGQHADDFTQAQFLTIPLRAGCFFWARECASARHDVIDRCGLALSPARDSLQVSGYRASFRWLCSTRSRRYRRATLSQAPESEGRRGYQSES